MPAAVRQGLQLKAPKKASKEGVKAKHLPSLKTAAISPLKSNRIDIPGSVKNYLLKGSFEVKLKPEDATSEAHIIFLLDTSGSMGTDQQMSYVKGLIEQTLKTQGYKNVQYALLMLDGENARIVQAFTPNHKSIIQQSHQIRTKGKTNLGAAFIKVNELCRNIDKSTVQLFTFTDGKVNVGLGDQKPFEYAIDCYKKYVGSRLKSSLIDTEKGMVRLGKAKELAERLGVKYQQID